MKQPASKCCQIVAGIKHLSVFLSQWDAAGSLPPESQLTLKHEKMALKFWKRELPS